MIAQCERRWLSIDVKSPMSTKKYPCPATYSERSASTVFTRAARTGTAEAITAAVSMTKADATKESIPGRCTSATYVPMPRAKLQSAPLTSRQQLFIEAANLMLPVREMDLQNPMPLLTFLIGRAHR